LQKAKQAKGGKIWMYFATILKTTAPVKLPISQLSLFVRYNTNKVNINPALTIRFPNIVNRHCLFSIGKGCSRFT